METNPANFVIDASGGDAGVSNKLARADHAHPISFSLATPETDSASGGVGANNNYALSDHSHPINVPTSGTPSTVTEAASASHGSSANYARSDHVHEWAGVRTANATLIWASESGAKTTGAIGFTPAFAIALFAGHSGIATRGAISIGTIRGTGGEANSVATTNKAQEGGVDTQATHSLDGDSAGGVPAVNGGYQTAHTLDLNCTEFGSSEIEITPTGTVTGTMFLLIVGYD